MAINAVPTISKEIYLQDWSEAVKKMEGEDCPRKEQAWVRVRQATEGDQLQVSQRYEDIEYTYTPDGSTMEKRTSNVLEDRMFKAYLVLVEVANILDKKGKPVFKFKDGPDYPKFDGEYSEFQDRWALLPSVGADAIELAVLSLNRQWDYLGIVAAIEKARGKKPGEETEDRSSDT